MMIANRGFTRGLFNGASIGTLAIALNLPLSAQAGGLPSGGHYVSGHGSIDKANQSVTVKQSSTTGIIDWNKFSVGSKSAVTFDNGAGATLNRVTGGNLSTIAGQLHATGSLYLINNAGVIVSGTGRVVTGGNFLATSGNIGTAFDGDTRFKAGNGKVINRGTIVAGGTASLGGSNVTDTGTIRGSRVRLQASHDLDIGGSIVVRNADGAGGTVIATGRHIAVAASANISASGTRGGTVLIGGDVHGGAIAADNFVGQNVHNAETTSIAKGARINANGQTTGGDIVIWSDGRTSFDGKISATGRTAGGFAEVSSHDLLGFTGRANLTSTSGNTGTLLLDPENVTIENGTTSGGSLSGGTFTPSAGDSVLSVANLQAALASANVMVTTGSSGSQAGDITVLSPVTWSSSHTLTLDAFHSIAIDAAITVTGSGGVSLTTNGGGTGGDYTFNGGNLAFTDVVGSTTKGALTINGTSFTLVNNVKKLASDIASNAFGSYALAANYNAINDGTYAASPVGTSFEGTFEGLGNTIENLKISDNAGGNIGLFAFANAATLRDIGLADISVVALANTANADIGGLVGQANNTNIENVNVTGIMRISGASSSGGVEVGGLVGSESGSITASSSDVSIDAGAEATVGGLIGDGGNVSIDNSRAGGDIVVGTNSSAGGFAGVLSNGTVSNSYASGMVAGAGGGNAGGFAGALGEMTVSHDYATGDVFLGQGVNGLVGGFAGIASGAVDHSWSSGNVLSAGTAQSVETIEGGFIGFLNSGTISTSFSTGDVTSGSSEGDMLQGGFVGFMSTGAAISDSYSTGVVTAGPALNGSVADLIGGFVGYSRGAETESYSTGAVNVRSVAEGATADVGGFIGNNDPAGTVDESYSSGKVTAGVGAIAGGFAGDNQNTSGLSASVADYYNKTANTGAAIGQDAATTSNVGGITAGSMFRKGSYSGWTFGKTGGGAGWVIVDPDGSLNDAGGVAGGTLPMLLSEYSTTITSAHQLQLVSLDLSADYTLANTIDASGTARGDVWGASGFDHIGTLSQDYGGTFNGQGNVIVNLTQKNSADAFGGVFANLNTGATIENLGLINISIDNSALGGGSDGAIVAGFSDGSLTNVYTTGKVRAGASGTSGGLAGFNDGTISHSWSSATISGTGGTAVGGLAGINNGDINTSYATGNVTVTIGGSSEAGGLVGLNNGATIETSYSSGSVTGIDTTVGAFVGDNAGTITKSYFNSSRNGTTRGSGKGTNSGVTGLTSGQMERKGSFVGWTFGSLGSGANWVIVDTDASINNAGGASGATSPLLTDEYSTTIHNAHQLQLIALDTNANYTIANDIDASGTAGGDVWFGPGFAPLGALMEFGGSFDGEGHTISGLTINNTAGNPEVGLFAETKPNATIGDVSLSKVSITSPTTGSVGALAGINQGAIYGASVTGNVTGSASDQFVGGIVGSNVGSIVGSQSAAMITSTGNNGGGAGGSIAGSNIGQLSWDTAGGLVHVDGDDVGAGGLVGINAGAIADSSASTTVTLTDSSTTSGNAVGGLVGTNDGGTIASSYAVGSVSGSGGAGSFAGGFVGMNENGGAITSSYAMGAANGSFAGGFVGVADGGSIKGAYSTGVATGMHASGFAGTTQASPVFSDDYWDSATSGITTGSVAGTFAKTTTALQAGLLGGLGASNWSIVAGASYPYLNWQFLGDTPEVVSGNIYSGYAGSPESGETVAVDSLGLNLAPALSAPSGANGYFYVLLNPSSYDPTNAALLVYAGGQGGATFVDNLGTGIVGGLHIYGGFLNDTTSEGEFSEMAANLNMAQSAGGAAILAGLPNLLIDDNAGFDIDQSIDTHELIINSSVGSSVAQGEGTISADSLLLTGGGNYDLQDANAIGTLAATSGTLNVTSRTLTIGTVAGMSGITAKGSVGLTTTSGNLSFTQQLTAAGQMVSLVSAGKISESGAGFIDASSLTGSSVGATSVNSALNSIADLGSFAAGSTFALTDNRSLTVDGDVGSTLAVDTHLTTLGAGHSIVVDAEIAANAVYLISSGAISENDGGDIDAKTLTGSSTNSAVLNSVSNTITDLGPFTTGGNAAFELTDNHGLTVDATVNSGFGTLDLTTVGSGNNLAIKAAITGGTINLVTTGAAVESSAGAVTASKLDVTANTGISLTSSNNKITKLGTHTTNSGPNKVTL